MLDPFGRGLTSLIDDEAPWMSAAARRDARPSTGECRDQPIRPLDTAGIRRSRGRAVCVSGCRAAGRSVPASSRPIRASGRRDYRMKAPASHVYPVDPPPEHSAMRSFDDKHGSHWQAALMEASFGNVLLIFTRIGGEGVLQRPLETANMQEAQHLLADADESRLRALLADAQPWG
ncbi:MAG: hypothetical protein ACREP0_10785 [Rhodanobacteraceae bacterium]